MAAHRATIRTPRPDTRRTACASARNAPASPVARSNTARAPTRAAAVRRCGLSSRPTPPVAARISRFGLRAALIGLPLRVADAFGGSRRAFAVRRISIHECVSDSKLVVPDYSCVTQCRWKTCRFSPSMSVSGCWRRGSQAVFMKRLWRRPVARSRAGPDTLPGSGGKSYASIEGPVHVRNGQLHRLRSPPARRLPHRRRPRLDRGTCRHCANKKPASYGQATSSALSALRAAAMTDLARPASTRSGPGLAACPWRTWLWDAVSRSCWRRCRNRR